MSIDLAVKLLTELDTVNIARVAHEANRAYCLTLGDDSQPPWDQAPDWQRQSAIAGVLALKRNPYLGPDQMHERWWATKQSQGWVYGPVKDPEQKTHPCCRPWELLPPEQRRKDILFGSVVRALL